MDLPNIENLTIGMQVSPDVLLRLIGRALHSNRHRTEGPEYGVYVCQQQFSTSRLGVTPFGVLSHGLRLDGVNGFPWIPGQVLMPRARHDADDAALRARLCESITVPGVTPGNKPEIAIGDGGRPLVIPRKQATRLTANDPGGSPAFTEYDATLHPTEERVRAFLQSMGAGDCLGYLSSITLTAKEAHRSERSWTQAVREKVSELRERAKRFARE